MRENHLNLSHLVRIFLRDKKKAKEFVYREEKKYFFGIFQEKEGFVNSYEIMSDSLKYSKEDLEKEGFIVEGKNVFYKPQLSLFFSNKEEFHKEFDTFDEAKMYAGFVKSESMFNNRFLKFEP
jgi:hypothetical protein